MGLKKALGLFRKCNPPLLEWLRSPIVYQQAPSFLEKLKAIPWEPTQTNGEWGFSPQRCAKHYVSMAAGNIRNYFEADLVPLKKYLYVLRPLLACQWIEEKMSLPPVAFDELWRGLDLHPSFQSALKELVAMKKAGTELGMGPKIEPLEHFVSEAQARYANIKLPDSEPHVDDLNELFVECIGGLDK